jgi:hypothetical protein
VLGEEIPSGRVVPYQEQGLEPSPGNGTFHQLWEEEVLISCSRASVNCLAAVGEVLHHPLEWSGLVAKGVLEPPLGGR